MLILLSPAKTLDFETRPGIARHTQPAMLKDSVILVEQLRKLTPAKIAALMNISPALGKLNATRYKEWSVPFNRDNAKQALLAFRGDVYTGLDADSLNAVELDYAQRHVRILSGLYGVLRPLDLMRPYRLEMGTGLQTVRGNNLYDFWGERITVLLNKTLKQQQDDIVINLASNEYYKSVKPSELKARVINPVFRYLKN